MTRDEVQKNAVCRTLASLFIEEGGTFKPWRNDYPTETGFEVLEAISHDVFRAPAITEHIEDLTPDGETILRLMFDVWNTTGRLRMIDVACLDVHLRGRVADLIRALVVRDFVALDLWVAEVSRELSTTRQARVKVRPKEATHG